MAYTIRSIFLYRSNEEKMREVYYLAGLVDCMINRVHPLLRTDSISEMYKKIITLKLSFPPAGTVPWTRSFFH